MKVNEMIVGFILMVGISVAALAQTVINYEDGSTYTLSGKEEVYVSSQPLWKQRTLNNGNLIQIKRKARGRAGTTYRPL